MEKVINGVFCRVVEKEWDVYFDMALTMFEEIVKNNQAGKPSVFIVPVGPTDQYPILAKLINSQRVSLKNVHFFNMDEYLVSPTQWISEDDPMSFHGRMKREFYDRVDESLVMPESQRHFPEPGHEKEYDELIANLGGALADWASTVMWPSTRRRKPTIPSPRTRMPIWGPVCCPSAGRPGRSMPSATSAAIWRECRNGASPWA